MNKFISRSINWALFFLFIAILALLAGIILYSYSILEQGLMLWPIWLSLTVILTIVVIGRNKIVWSIRELLFIVTWLSIGGAIYSVSRDDLAESSFKTKINDIKSWNGNLTRARDYAENLALPGTASEKLVVFVTNDITELTNQIQAHSERVTATTHKLTKLPLLTKTGRELLFEQRTRAKFLKQLQQTAQEIKMTSLAPNTIGLDSATWHERIERLQAVEQKLTKQLQVIENARILVPLMPAGEPVSDVIRPAAFEILRWPGLSDQQLQAVQHYVDQEPFIARVLLIDYAISNAQKQLQKQGQVGSEETALDKLQSNKLISALFN